MLAIIRVGSKTCFASSKSDLEIVGSEILIEDKQFEGNAAKPPKKWCNIKEVVSSGEDPV